MNRTFTLVSVPLSGINKLLMCGQRLKCAVLHQYCLSSVSSVQKNGLLGQRDSCIAVHQITKFNAVHSQYCILKRLSFHAERMQIKRHLHTSLAFCDPSDLSKEPSNVVISDGKVNLERLQNIKELMTMQIPDILSHRHEYRIYTSDVVLQNNWDVSNPRHTVGIGAYVMAIVKARFYIHSNYAKVKVTVIDSGIDKESGTVHVKWRISYLPQAKAFMFWKYKPFQFRATASKLSESVDGTSTFYVNSKGFIYKHVLTRANVQTLEEKNEPS